MGKQPRIQNMGGSLSQTGSQMEQCSDSVSATPSSSLPSKMEKMHMQGSVTSSPSSENIIETTGKESSECDINSYRTSSSKRRRYYIEEKPLSEASHLREQNDSFLSKEKSQMCENFTILLQIILLHSLVTM